MVFMLYKVFGEKSVRKKFMKLMELESLRVVCVNVWM